MSKKLFEQDQELTLAQIEASIDVIIDEGVQRRQDNIDAWHQESTRIINSEITDYGTRG